MPSEVPISCMAAYTEEAEQDGGFVPLFVGRDDGTVERYDAMQDAELGIPNVVFYAHRRPVTGIVATSATELHTCSLDGTMKQWTLGDAPPESVHAGGARVRASLVKTTTFPFGVSVMVPEEGNRLLLGGDDGSLTLMESERRSTWRAHDVGPVTAIAVDTEGSNAVLTGGTDGTIYVWDMEFGRSVCEMRGHTGPIRALSFVPVPASVPVVRPKRSADGAGVKDVLVHDNGDDGGAATCVVSSAADGTVKVWLLPDLQEANAAAELLERHQQQLQELENVIGTQRRSLGISFEEPAPKQEVSSTIDGEGHHERHKPSSPPARGAEDEDESHRNGQHVESVTKDATDAVTEAEERVGDIEKGSMNKLDAKEQFLRQQASATAFKSAIKAPERRVVPFHAALGTVELPQTPFSHATPSSSPSAGGDGDGPAGPSLLFIGAAQGEVYGLRTRRLVKEVCLHTAYNFQKVQQEVTQVQRTLREGTRVYTKAAAAKMKAEESAQLAAAAKARRAKLAEERAARQRAAEERRAARRKAAAEEDEEDEEGEGEEEEEAEDPFDNGEDDEDDFNEDEENTLDEEEEEEEERDAAGAADGATPQKPRRPASWKKLSEEQRAALEEFCTAQEAERDRRVAALRAATEAHIAQVQPLAKTVYHRSRAQFANLSYTTAGHIHGGTAVTAMAAASLVPANADKVYAAQVNVVVPVTVAIGLTKL
ncbi:hypothetical protein ABB37_09393 [Leptomonas pyrrhocoris]|uniref:Uncharacterized protein n=1 Tax=Leptomonas pyrrhocoris TaxID=157538 RepID=A0A0M9FQS9_LEPPY|nr:hypothetical protein ABB37_09393 [Leptomonas pyrrhocoris]KPA74103.1 hypothetical protein ABB37_09393 [Leptomonas pyrrhocoris]|eukprot:XP_015652542.1 hypothetical protein ABB37_09393 [Leptomonas pyrrhocoris]